MADKVLTQAAYDTDNIQNEADQVKGQATALKVTFDKTGNDAKTYNNTSLITELQSQTLNDSGAHAIGLNTADTVATNVADELALIRQAGSGALPPDDSITLAKQNSTVKTGLLADLDTTDKTDLVSGINENVISRIAELDTGAADAYVVTTVGTFNRVDGNILPFIPANANTGASTINEDGNGIADIKKWVEGVSTALEEGDLPKFQKAELVWNSSEADFFYAPKGGATKRGTLVLNVSGTGAASVTQTVNYSGKGRVKAIINTNVSVYEWYMVIDSVRYPASGNYEFTSLPQGMYIDFPFDDSFEFYSENARIVPLYEEDEVLKCPTTFSAAALTTLKLTESGSGRINGLSIGNGGRIQLIIDGAQVFGASDTQEYLVSGGNFNIDKEYKNGFSLYTADTNNGINYETF